MTIVNLSDVKTTRPSRVEVFFQAMCGDTPVPGLSVNQDPGSSADAITLYEDEKLISRNESQPLVVQKHQAFRMFVLLLLDLSGSVVGDQQNGVGSVITQAQEYVGNVLQNAQSVDLLVAVAAFDGRKDLQPIVEFGRDKSTIDSKLGGVTCGTQYCVDPSTNLNGAIINGLAQLDAAQNAAKAEGIKYTSGVLVTFTDGTDQAHRVTDGDAVSAVQSSRDSSFAIGLGGEINQDQLKQLGPAGFEFASDQAELGPAFQRIASKIVGFANSFYQIDYCSPSRSGAHSLRTEVRFQGITGTLDSSFNADGFSYGCIADPAKCPDNAADCDNDKMTCESRLDTDASNCGACDVACAADKECVDGVCLPRCGQAEARCGGECVDLSTSASHCGACDHACERSGEVCLGSSCVCSGGLTDCGSRCADTTSSVDDCGTCGHACTRPGEMCSSGACACPGGFVDCGDHCADTLGSVNDCGGCNMKCAPGTVCQGGQCGCPSDTKACADQCLSCGNSTAYCGVNGPDQCCPQDYPHFCDVAGWGTGCFSVPVGVPLGDCNTVVTCADGKSYLCPTGHKFDCNSKVCI